MSEHPKYPRQQPRYGDGTVTLQTTDHGEITIPEPEWCDGHEDKIIGPIAEISHDGAEIAASIEHEQTGRVKLLCVGLTHAPYLTVQPEPHPLAYVEGIDAASFDADGLRRIIAAVRAFLTEAEDVAARLDALAEGDQR